MRAIDLYAGIGGWSLGFTLAGINVVRSFERWQPAIDTYNANLGADAKAVDLRVLDLRTLPKGVDIVAGSPPCTEFSFANRGGNGDVAEGVRDVARFLEIVRHVNPKFWIMENVPRVAEVVREGFSKKSHPLYAFRELEPQIEIINFADFGLPQSRQRCIIGRFPLDCLNAYKAGRKRLTLGDVVSALSGKRSTVDPLWDLTTPRSELTEMEMEEPLDPEQLRMNREAKIHHPVYNNMAFPDRLDGPSRTVTGTCTRVSRESIIIADERSAGSYRRLTIRERASLQGFPLTYQFYSKNYTDKVRMIGNAVPPPFAYLVAAAIKGIKPADLQPLSEAGAILETPAEKAPVTVPNGRNLRYPSNRGFRAAIPSLRFKSGMRFELINEHRDNQVSWRIRFFFGRPRDIQTIDLDGKLLARLRRYNLLRGVQRHVEGVVVSVNLFLADTAPMTLQQVWSHQAKGRSPYELVDLLGAAAGRLERKFRPDQDGAEACVLKIAGYDSSECDASGTRKLRQHAASILCGMILATWFNASDWHSKEPKSPRVPARKSPSASREPQRYNRSNAERDSSLSF